MNRRGGGRSGTSVRVANDIAARYRAVAALWFAVHNDPVRSVTSLAPEFFYLVGEVMEGRPLAALKFTAINRASVLAHAEE